jgi:hypothetical protein
MFVVEGGWLTEHFHRWNCFSSWVLRELELFWGGDPGTRLWQVRIEGEGSFAKAARGFSELVCAIAVR